MSVCLCTSVRAERGVCVASVLISVMYLVGSVRQLLLLKLTARLEKHCLLSLCQSFSTILNVFSTIHSSSLTFLH